MVFQPTGPGPRTARVKIVQNKRGRLPLGVSARRTASSGSASPLTPNGTLCQPMGGTSRSPTKRAECGTLLESWLADNALVLAGFIATGGTAALWRIQALEKRMEKQIVRTPARTGGAST